MPVETVDRDVQLAVGEPFDERRIGVVERLRRLAVPGQAGEGSLHPEGGRIGIGLGVQRFVRDAGAGLELRRGREHPPLVEQSLDGLPLTLHVHSSARTRRGASPDDSQAARRPSTRGAGYTAAAGILAPCLLPGRSARRRCAFWRSRLRASSCCARREHGLGAAPDTSASAYAVMINVPGAQSSSTGTSPAGSYQYRDLVSVSSYTAGSALTYGQAYGHGELSGVTLLGGAVTATSVVARAFADGRSSSADGTFGGSVTGLVVDGADVSVQPGGQFPIRASAGALSTSAVLRSNGAYSGSEVALHIHLAVGWHDLPAGTEILLGYAAAAASGHPVIASAKQPGANGATLEPLARGGTATTNPVAIGAPVVPVPPGDQTPSGAGGGNVPTGIEAPPPGGFTATPPIDPGRAKQLLGPGYVFPVPPAVPITATTSARRAPTRASTRAATCSRPRGRRSLQCRPGRCVTSAGTGSAAGASGSRT